MDQVDGTKEVIKEKSKKDKEKKLVKEKESKKDKKSKQGASDEILELGGKFHLVSSNITMNNHQNPVFQTLNQSSEFHWA